MATNGVLHLAHPKLRDDLATYFGRAARVEDGALRISAINERVVALWVPILRPAGILDDSPLVIAVRAINASISDVDDADRHEGRFDAVVPLRGMLDRLAREPGSPDQATSIPLPPDRLNESWTGQRPPVTGWERIAELDAEQLTAVAESGIESVGTQYGGMLGQIRAERVRTETWTQTLPSASVRTWYADEQPLPPAGAAFAAHALGFLPITPNTNASVHVAIAPGWWRIAFPAGQVLVRRK